MVDEHVPTQEQVTNQILKTVADSDGVDETELPPLYGTIDPNALETLFRNGPGKVVFEYCEHTVTVDHEYTVEVTPADTH